MLFVGCCYNSKIFDEAKEKETVKEKYRFDFVARVVLLCFNALICDKIKEKGKEMKYEGV